MALAGQRPYPWQANHWSGRGSRVSVSSDGFLSTPGTAAFMSALSDDLPLDPTLAEDVKDARHVAYSYVEDAFAEARQDGLDSDSLAHAALFAAMRTLVETYGEEATAVFAEALPEKIRHGNFTTGTRH
jgi:hypothetical protein